MGKRLILFMLLITVAFPTLAFNSYLEYKTHIDKGGNNYCLSSIVWNASDMFTNKIPERIGPTGSSQDSTNLEMVRDDVAMEPAVVIDIASIAMPGLMAPFNILQMFNICTFSFVMPYYEELNFAYNHDKATLWGKNDKYMMGNTKFTEEQIPYRFQCVDKQRRGYDKRLCERYPEQALADPDEVNRINIYFRYGNLINQGKKSEDLYSSREVDHPKKNFYHVSLHPTKEQIGRMFVSVKAYAYYRLSSKGDKVFLCAGAPYTLLPVEVGCIPVAPPITRMKLSEETVCMFANTRAQYMLMDRKDLNSLGASLRKQLGRDTSVTKFLESDFHMTSTVVGAFKDLLAQAVSRNPDDYNPECGAHFNTFFYRIQIALKQIALAVILLHICLFAINLIGSPRAPDPGTLIMAAIKLGLVLYFITGNIWYGSDKEGGIGFGQNIGLYRMLLNIPEELADIFMRAANLNDPMQRCIVTDGGGEVIHVGQRQWAANAPTPRIDEELEPLDENNHPLNMVNLSSSCIGQASGPGVVYQTAGARDAKNQCVVETTVWDAVDCRVANLLNMGSCNYKPSGLIVTWMIIPAINALFMSTFSLPTFIIAVCAVIYVTMMFLIIFKYVHTFVLSLVSITMLVLLSPLFICFVLFKQTEKMFKSWLQTLIGYCLYPGMLFAYLSFVFVTFDTIYYGFDNLASTYGQDRSSVVAAVNANCQTNPDKPYCLMLMNSPVADPCDANNNIYNDFTADAAGWMPFISYKVLKIPGSISTAMLIFMKMMLFAGLFYLFSEKVMQILAQLSGIQGMGLDKHAGGSVNMLKATASTSSIAKFGMSMAMKGGKVAINKIRNKIRGKKEGDDKVKRTVASNKNNNEANKKGGTKGSGNKTIIGLLFALLMLASQDAYAMRAFEKCYGYLDFNLKKEFRLTAINPRCENTCNKCMTVFSVRGEDGQELNQDHIYNCMQSCQTGKTYRGNKRNANGRTEQIFFGQTCNIVAGGASGKGSDTYPLDNAVRIDVPVVPNKPIRIKLVLPQISSGGVIGDGYIYKCGINSQYLHPKPYTNNLDDYNDLSNDSELWHIRNEHPTFTDIIAKNGDDIIIRYKGFHKFYDADTLSYNYNLLWYKHDGNFVLDYNAPQVLFGSKIKVFGIDEDVENVEDPTALWSAFKIYGLKAEGKELMTLNSMERSMRVDNDNNTQKQIIFSGALTDFDNQFRRIVLKHPLLSNSVGGLAVEIERRGCKEVKGESIQYAFIPVSKQLPNEEDWQNVIWNNDDRSVELKSTQNAIMQLWMRVNPQRDLSAHVSSCSRLAGDAFAECNKVRNAVSTFVNLPGESNTLIPAAYGAYYVETIQPRDENSCSFGAEKITCVFGNAVKKFQNMFYGPDRTSGIVPEAFNAIVRDSKIILMIRALLLMFIVWTGLSYVLGLSPMNQQDGLLRIGKMTIIIMLLSPNAWYFFNTYLFVLFIDGSTELIATMAGQSDIIQRNYGAGGVVNVFKIFDPLLGLLLEPMLYARVWALMTDHFFSIGIGVVIITCVYLSFVTAFKVLIMYLVSIVVIALCLIVAPVFICFILFKYTRDLFDNWLNTLISYSLQPMGIFLGLALMSGMLYSSLKAILGFPICSICVFSIVIPLPVINKPTCLIPGFQSIANMTASSSSMNTVVSVNAAFFLLILTHSLAHISDMMAQLIQRVSGFYSGISLAQAAASASGNAMSLLMRSIPIFSTLGMHNTRLSEVRRESLQNWQKKRAILMQNAERTAKKLEAQGLKNEEFNKRKKITQGVNNGMKKVLDRDLHALEQDNINGSAAFKAYKEFKKYQAYQNLNPATSKLTPEREKVLRANITSLAQQEKDLLIKQNKWNENSHVGRALQQLIHNRDLGVSADANILKNRKDKAVVAAKSEMRIRKLDTTLRGVTEILRARGVNEEEVAMFLASYEAAHRNMQNSVVPPEKVNQALINSGKSVDEARKLLIMSREAHALHTRLVANYNLTAADKAQLEKLGFTAEQINSMETRLRGSPNDVSSVQEELRAAFYSSVPDLIIAEDIARLDMIMEQELVMNRLLLEAVELMDAPALRIIISNNIADLHLSIADLEAQLLDPNLPPATRALLQAELERARSLLAQLEAEEYSAKNIQNSVISEHLLDTDLDILKSRYGLRAENYKRLQERIEQKAREQMKNADDAALHAMIQKQEKILQEKLQAQLAQATSTQALMAALDQDVKQLIPGEDQASRLLRITIYEEMRRSIAEESFSAARSTLSVREQEILNEAIKQSDGIQIGDISLDGLLKSFAAEEEMANGFGSSKPDPLRDATQEFLANEELLKSYTQGVDEIINSTENVSEQEIQAKLKAHLDSFISEAYQVSQAEELYSRAEKVELEAEKQRLEAAETAKRKQEEEMTAYEIVQQDVKLLEERAKATEELASHVYDRVHETRQDLDKYKKQAKKTQNLFASISPLIKSVCLDVKELTTAIREDGIAPLIAQAKAEMMALQEQNGVAWNEKAWASHESDLKTQLKEFARNAYEAELLEEKYQGKVALLENEAQAAGFVMSNARNVINERLTTIDQVQSEDERDAQFLNFVAASAELSCEYQKGVASKKNAWLHHRNADQFDPNAIGEVAEVKKKIAELPEQEMKSTVRDMLQELSPVGLTRNQMTMIEIQRYQKDLDEAIRKRTK